MKKQDVMKFKTLENFFDCHKGQSVYFASDVLPILEIIKKYRKGQNLSEIARFYGVTRQRIHQIIKEAGL